MVYSSNYNSSPLRLKSSNIFVYCTKFHYLLQFQFRTVVLHDISLSTCNLTEIVSRSLIHGRVRVQSWERISDGSHACHCY